MTRRPLATAVSLLVLALLLGCTSEQERARQAAVEPYLNVIAAEVAQQPSVICAVAYLPSGGVPGGEAAGKIELSVSLDIPREDEPAIRQALLDAGRVAWESPVRIGQLSVVASGGTVTLTEFVRGTKDDFGPLNKDELITLYGPRPSLPATLPPITDPGRQNC